MGTLAGENRDPSDCVGGAGGFIPGSAPPLRSLDKRGRLPGSLRGWRFGAAARLSFAAWLAKRSAGGPLAPALRTELARANAHARRGGGSCLREPTT